MSLEQTREATADAFDGPAFARVARELLERRQEITLAIGDVLEAFDADDPEVARAGSRMRALSAECDLLKDMLPLVATRALGDWWLRRGLDVNNRLAKVHTRLVHVDPVDCAYGEGGA